MKTMKKLFAILLAITLICATPLTLCAQEANVTATVIAANEPTYQITIPASLSADDLHRTAETDYYEKEFEVSINEVSFLNGKVITVRVYSENGDFVLQGTDHDETLAFEVFSTADLTNPLESGDVFATFDEARAQTGMIRIDQKDIRVADTYTGSLSFAFFVTDTNE